MNRINDRNAVAFVLLGGGNDLVGHFANLFHEGLAGNLTVLDQRKLMLPLGGELGLRQFVNAKSAHELHELEGFGIRNELTAFAPQILLLNKTFDRLCTRRRRTRAPFQP